MFSICLSCKVSLLAQTKHIMSLPTIQNVVSLSTSFCFFDLWYYLSKLIISKSSHLHLMLGILSFCFWSLFNLCKSCYSYPEACHFVTNLKSTKGSSNQCRPKLSEGKCSWIHPTIPHGMCSRAFCWAICKLYYGYWYWFVSSSSICHLNILLSFSVVIWTTFSFCLLCPLFPLWLMIDDLYICTMTHLTQYAICATTFACVT